jgi:hypothetical protein
MVTHPTTIRTQRCLTSVIKWLPVCTTWQNAVFPMKQYLIGSTLLPKPICVKTNINLEWQSNLTKQKTFKEGHSLAGFFTEQRINYFSFFQEEKGERERHTKLRVFFKILPSLYERVILKYSTSSFVSRVSFVYKLASD